MTAMTTCTEQKTTFVLKCMMLVSVIAIAIIGLLLPPPGQVDASVLIADGILTAAYMLLNLNNVHNFKLTFGNFSIEINE